MKLAQFAPLARVADVRFFSLQRYVEAREAEIPPDGMNLIDWTAEFSNFNDAALMHHLDLVITVDTSVAHLAGALARPTWVLLPFSSDWRWLVEREDSPWYPTMRLFRQTSRGDWAGVIDRVAQAIRDLAGRHSGIQS